MERRITGHLTASKDFGEQDFRLAESAYDHAKSCYDREYLFQWAEMDARIHKQAEAQVLAKQGCAAGDNGMQSRRPDRALPSSLLSDQWALHA